MKIEIIKEVDKISGNIVYSLEKDGRYVAATATEHFDKIQILYSLAIDAAKNKVALTTREVIKSIEI
jgi:hypothetical protein